MRRHFQMFADYNRWANALVYEACAELTDEEYRADQGAFFGSAHRTLNHLLYADRIWLISPHCGRPGLPRTRGSSTGSTRWMRASLPLPSPTARSAVRR